jgi:hypothetical protein
MFGRAQDAMLGRAQDAMFGRAQEAMFGRAQDAMFGRAQDAMFGRARDDAVIGDYGDVILSLSKDELRRLESNRSTANHNLAVALSLAKGDRANDEQSEARR